MSVYFYSNKSKLGIELISAALLSETPIIFNTRFRIYSGSGEKSFGSFEINVSLSLLTLN